MTDEENESKQNQDPQTTYSIRIGEDLHKRIQQHIYVLKKLEKSGISKQEWMKEAIKEKLRLEEELNPADFVKERHLCIRIEKDLTEKIDHKVELNKRLRQSFSKKKWFVDAFYEKLEREEAKTKKLLEKESLNIISKKKNDES